MILLKLCTKNTPFYSITDFINSFQSDITFEFLTRLLQSHYRALFYSGSVHIAAEQQQLVLYYTLMYQLLHYAVDDDALGKVAFYLLASF